MLRNVETLKDGGTGGVHPDTLSVEDYEALGLKRTVLKAIRAKCLDCCCYSSNEVRLCISSECALWPFRLGKKPKAFRSEVSEERREAASKRLAQYRAKGK